jgi:hypothetical protein
MNYLGTYLVWAYNDNKFHFRLYHCHLYQIRVVAC